jgi:hypothetical protein
VSGEQRIRTTTHDSNYASSSGDKQEHAGPLCFKHPSRSTTTHLKFVVWFRRRTRKAGRPSRQNTQTWSRQTAASDNHKVQKAREQIMHGFIAPNVILKPNEMRAQRLTHVQAEHPMRKMPCCSVGLLVASMIPSIDRSAPNLAYNTKHSALPGLPP